jgi:predicted acyltransferase (DUF342 family)
MEPLGAQLAQCRAENGLSRISIEGMDVLLVGGDGFDFRPRLLQNINAVMLSHAGLVPDGQVIDADIYATGLLTVGELAAVRAALGRADVILQKNSAVLRWLHADGKIYLRRGSASYGRLSAGQAIHLEPECSFERMYAPRIVVLDANHGSLSATRAVDVSAASDLDNGFTSRRRVRVSGDFVLPAGESLNANVIATRDVRLGTGSRLFGTCKSYRDTVLEEDASVYGGVVCGRSLHVAANGFVAGPVMVEGDVLIGQGSRIGAPDAITSVSSTRAQLAAGCQLHGTIWARARGMVEG